MNDRTVWVFFYGSYMNPEVLRGVQIEPVVWEVGRLLGFELQVAPRANLIRSDAGVVYGVLATLTHPELSRLYRHAEDVLGEVYHPEAVLVEVEGGHWRPALCYIAHEMRPGTVDPAYVDRIAKAARKHGLPDWYVERIESLGPNTSP